MTRKINTKRTSLISAISAAAIVVACGPEPESPPAADDAGASSCTGGSSDTGGASTGGSSTGGSSTTGGWAGRDGGSGDCNTLQNIGTEVHPVADPGPIPEMTGGPLVDGIFVLTSSVHYDGASADSAATVKQTMLITDNGRTAQHVVSFDGGPDMRSTRVRSPSGNELNASEVCPVPAPPNRSPYTATPNSLTIFVEQAGANLVVTFTRPEPGCVSDGENSFCAPSGFPFVTRTFPVTDSCAGGNCFRPNPTLAQPEAGTLCMSGTAREHAGFPLILFSTTPDFGQVLQAFDADALGITDVSFTVDAPPESGLVVNAGIIHSYSCSTTIRLRRARVHAAVRHRGRNGDRTTREFHAERPGEPPSDLRHELDRAHRFHRRCGRLRFLHPGLQVPERRRRRGHPVTRKSKEADPMRHIQDRLATFLSVIGAAALAIACGSEQQSKPPANDAESDSCTGGSSGTGATSTGGSSTGGSSTGGSSTGGWAGSGGACNTLANLGTVVHYEADPAPIPEMTGGPITDGTYVLTSLVHYAGVSADPMSTVKQTILVTGNGTTVEQVIQFDGVRELRRTLSQAPAGNELNVSEVCPEQVAQDPLPYTATPTSLTLVFEPAGSNLVITFTRLEPGCVSDGENLLCAPSGFPFVTRTFASTDSCLGTDCVPPNPTLTQPESGTLCISGTVPEFGQAGFPLILFSSTPDFSTILQAFDADALGITDVLVHGRFTA